MINENVNDEETDIHDSAMKNIMQIYHDDHNKTYDSARSSKTKRSITQRRSNRSVEKKEKKKKKLSFNNQLVETINIESYKSYTRKMYIMPSHGMRDVEKNSDKCCEDSVCIIV
jgi:superoxide dismutase